MNLDIKQLANNAKSLDIDDAVDLAEDLEEKIKIFFRKPRQRRKNLVEEGLNYLNSAGRLMQRQFVIQSIMECWSSN